MLFPLLDDSAHRVPPSVDECAGEECCGLSTPSATIPPPHQPARKDCASVPAVSKQRFVHGQHAEEGEIGVDLCGWSLSPTGLLVGRCGERSSITMQVVSAPAHGGAARAEAGESENRQRRHEAPSLEEVEDMRAWGRLHPALARAVVNIGLRAPTEIQQLSLGKNVSKTWRDSLLLAETGAGKTLAYLLPILHRLKEIEESTATRAKPRRPRALIIVPTRELGDQVLAVAKSLSHAARFSAAGAFGGGSRAEQASTLARGCDVLVATPMRLVALAEDGKVHFGDVRAVAVDEADTILAQGFRHELEKILTPVRAAAAHAARIHGQWAEMVRQQELSPADIQRVAAGRESPFHIRDQGELQIVLVAATISAAVTRLASKFVPAAVTLRTGGMHRVPPGIVQKFFEVGSMGQVMRVPISEGWGAELGAELGVGVGGGVCIV